MTNVLASSNNLSVAGRSAIATPGATRASLCSQLDPVEPTDPLKDTTSSEYRELQDLKQRDREVRQHEQAHVAAAGGHAKGGPRYTYENGPDGKRYAVGGEVSIDTSPVPNDPEATIRKMQTVRSAAHAPAEPSAQDRAVVAEASRTEAEARVELQEQQRAENNPVDEPVSSRTQQALNAYQGAAQGDRPQQSAIEFIV